MVVDEGTIVDKDYTAAAELAIGEFFGKLSGTIKAALQPVKDVAKDLGKTDIGVGFKKVVGFSKALNNIMGDTKLAKGLKAIKGAFTSMLGSGIQAAAMAELMKLVEPFVKLMELLSPIFDVLNALLTALVGEILVALMPYTKEFSNALLELMPTFKAIGAFIADVIIVVFQFLWNDVLKPFGEWIMNSLVPFFVALWDGLKAIGDWIVVTFKPLWDGLKAAMTVIFDWITVTFTPLWNILKAAIKVLYDWVVGTFMAIWSNLKIVMNALWKFLSSIFTPAWALMKSTLTSIWSFLSTVFIPIWNGLKAAFDFVKTGWEYGIGKLFGENGIIVTAFNAVAGFIKSIINGMIGVINAPIDAINALIPGTDSDLSTIPLLAEGGITNGPMLAMIGDNPGGRERVQPLDQYDAQQEALLTAIEGLQAEFAKGNKLKAEEMINNY